MRKHQEVYDSTVKLMLMITCLTLSHSNLNQVLQIILITKKMLCKCNNNCTIRILT